MPAACGWPCLAPVELVCCHVCTLAGSEVGTEGQRPLMISGAKKERRKSSGGIAYPTPRSLYFYHSIVTMVHKTSNKDYTVLLYKRGFRSTLLSKQHMKSADSDHLIYTIWL